jgi:hypothetical protein
MQMLEDKMTKIGLLVVAVIVGVYLVKTNEKKIGNDASLLIMAIIVMGGVYLIFLTNTETAESFFQENASLSSDDTDSVISAPDAAVEAEAEAEDDAQFQETEAQLAAQQAQVEAVAAIENTPEVEVQNSEPLGQNEVNKSVEGLGANNNQMPQECYPKDILQPQELLPRDTESTWAQSVPAGQGSLSDQNFLNAGFHVGVNTVGQSLRNANRQIRSDPPCPQVKVSPWMQTTIEPDTNRKPMEIGV